MPFIECAQPLEGLFLLQAEPNSLGNKMPLALRGE